MAKQVSEGSLHKWFKGSKSKDGKGGWVNVVTGGTCASDEPGEGTPKCVSSAKRASMTKAERLSAARRKKKADPGQQQKSGAAKPTYVSTDKKKKKMKESYSRSLSPLSEKAQKCWKGYEKKGTKKMFGKTYNNCVKKEEVILERQKTNQGERQSEEQHQSTYGKATVRNKRKFGFSGGNAINTPKETSRGTLINKRREEHKAKRGVKTKGMKEAYSANPAQQAAIAIAKKKKKEEDMVAMKKKKQKIMSSYDWRSELDNVDEAYGGKGSSRQARLKSIHPPTAKAAIKNVPDDQSDRGSGNKAKKRMEKMYAGYEPQGETIEEADKKGKGSGSKDACYHKVKSRYSVWPSAYASGALVKCRKVGAANWGNSSKKEDFSDWKSEFIWEDGDSSKKIDEGALDRFETIPGKPGRLRLKPDVKVKPVPLPQVKPDGVKPVPLPRIDPKPRPKLSDFVDHYDWRSELEEDWQKTNRQDKTDGMSQKAVNAYKRENPGSKLKTAVTAKPSTLKRGSKKAKRRKSFCSRMKGMKKRLTSAKTARDPDSRINKALRRWNC